MPSQAQKIALTKKLAARYPDGRYTARNVLISGTHTHSGPSGFFQYMLYDLAGSQHDNQTFTAFVDGARRTVNRRRRAATPLTRTRTPPPQDSTTDGARGGACRRLRGHRGRGRRRPARVDHAGRGGGGPATANALPFRGLAQHSVCNLGHSVRV